MRKVGLFGAVAYSPAAKDMPTLPGPISQTPLLQTKFVVISVGVRDDDGVGDGEGVGFGCAPGGGQRMYLSGTDYVAGGGWFSRSANISGLDLRSSRAVRGCARCMRSCSCPCRGVGGASGRQVNERFRGGERKIPAARDLR